jgi:hypothetical protein
MRISWRSRLSSKRDAKLDSFTGALGTGAGGEDWVEVWANMKKPDFQSENGDVPSLIFARRAVMR